MEEDNCVIEIKNLRKDYKMFARKKDRLLETLIPKINRHGTFCAVNDLSLEIRKGEVLGILGRNGAGKSTLLKMITGVVIPTSGEINIKGKVSSLLELGTAFNPELTGIENIYQHGQVMGLSNEEIKAKEQEIIEFADIGDHIFQPVKTYSSGMFARLAFACAINVNPDILIVDEVLSVGDIAFQLKCFKRFEEFKKENKTILFVTHSVGDVIRNCTRTIIIDAGRKIFDGSVKEGVEKYKKLIVGLDNKEENAEKVSESEDANIEENKPSISNQEMVNSDNWDNKLTINPNMIVYGNGKVDITDFGVFNLKGEPIASVYNSDEVIIKMKVKFNENIDEPIFAITIKDFKALDFCGANTIVNETHTGSYKVGDVVVVEFKQKIPIQQNKYTVSFGCTKIDYNGNLEVYQRKYDALLIEVCSYKEVLGLAKMESEITIKKQY